MESHEGSMKLVRADNTSVRVRRWKPLWMALLMKTGLLKKRFYTKEVSAESAWIFAKPTFTDDTVLKMFDQYKVNKKDFCNWDGEESVQWKKSPVWVLEQLQVFFFPKKNVRAWICRGGCFPHGEHIEASVRQANNWEHAVTYGAACGYNTCNTSLLYLWIMTAALRMSRTSPHKQGEMNLPGMRCIEHR